MMQLPNSHPMKTRSDPDAGSGMGIPSRQSGIALIVSLLLLIVITLVGLAAIHGTITQQQMAANFYDRQVALQSAEAALRAGEAAVAGISSAQLPLSTFVRDCSSSVNTCLAYPFADASVIITTVSTATFNAGTIAADQPRYAVDYLGTFTDRTKNTRQLSNSFNYGGTGGGTTSNYYRVTAQSGNPANIGDRSIVTLQTVIKR